MGSSQVARQNSVFPLARLPDEILRLVLAALRNVSLGDFASALRTTRAWNDLGSNMLWRDLVLRGGYLPRFTACVENLSSRDTLCRNIQSLTVCTQEGKGFFRYMANAGNSLRSLSEILPLMSNLHTFSFEHHPDPVDPWGSVSPKIDQIISLVRNLPASVRDLEVTAYATYKSFRSHDMVDDMCICEAISSRLAQLKSLRVILPQLCPKLFEHASSVLEHLSINVCKPDMQPFVQECYLADIQRSLSWDDVQAQKVTKSKNTIQTLLRCAREPSFTASHFPNLKKLTIIEPYHFDTRGASEKWHLINAHYYTRDESAPSRGSVVTHSYPIWPTGYVDGIATDPFHFIFRQCLHAVHSHKPADSKHVCRDLDVASYGNAICQHLEGLVGWTTTSTGARRPRFSSTRSEPTYLSSETLATKLEWSSTYRARRYECIRDYISEHELWYDPDAAKCTSLRQMKSFQQRYGVKPTEAGADYVWYLEAEHSENLLIARTFEGGFPDTPFDADKHEFCADIELVNKALEDPLDEDLLNPDDEVFPYPWSSA